MENEDPKPQGQVSAIMDAMYDKAKSLGPENVIINMEAFAAEIVSAAHVSALLHGDGSQERIDETIFLAWTTIMLAIVEQVMERTEDDESTFFQPDKLTFRIKKK